MTTAVEEETVEKVIPQIVVHPRQVSSLLFDIRMMICRNEIKEALAALEILDALFFNSRPV